MFSQGYRATSQGDGACYRNVPSIWDFSSDHPTSGAAFPMFTGPIAFPYFLRDSMGGMVWVAGGPRSLGVPGISVEGHLTRFLSTRRRLLWVVVDQGSQANSSLVST